MSAMTAVCSDGYEGTSNGSSDGNDDDVTDGGGDDCGEDDGDNDHHYDVGRHGSKGVLGGAHRPKKKFGGAWGRGGADQSQKPKFYYKILYFCVNSDTFHLI